MSKLDAMRWWEASTSSPELVYQPAWDQILRINNGLRDRDENNIHYARMYSNSYFAALSPTGYFVSKAASDKHKQRISLNIIANIADTVAARISKAKPKVTFLTKGGNFRLISKAKKLDKFILGQFQNLDLYHTCQRAFFDSLICDIGVVKVYGDANTGRIHAERVLPNEIKVDQVDAVYGTPSHLYQVKYIHKKALMEMFPDIPKRAIEEAASSPSERNTPKPLDPTTPDFAYVVEGWKLPSYPGAKDGRHIICLSNATLIYEEWEKEQFPFIFFRWSERQIGFYGQSLAERLNGIQIEINAMLRDIQYSRQFFAVPFIGVELGSKINRAQFNNVIAHIVDYAKTPPQFMTPPIAHQQWFDHLDRLIRQAYEIAGVSMLSATSRKPAGLEAAVALREYQDIESERFVLVGQRYEQSYLDASKLIIDAARDLYATDQKFSISVKGRRFIEEIPWKRVDLQDDQYMMQTFPTSMLPQTPPARLASVSELAERGYIDKDEAMSLLDFPDLERATNITNAAYDNIMWNIEQIVEFGRYVPPSAYQNLERGIKMFTAAINRAEQDGVPDRRIDMLRDWVLEAKRMQPPAPTATPVSGGVPPIPPPEGEMPSM